MKRYFLYTEVSKISFKGFLRPDLLTFASDTLKNVLNVHWLSCKDAYHICGFLIIFSYKTRETTICGNL